MGSPGIIEVYIPIQNVDTTAIVVTSPVSIYPMKLPIALISYKTPIYTIPRLSIFTKKISVHSWDPIKFRLELTDNEDFTILNELQEILIHKIVQYPEWSGSNKLTVDEVRSKFQPNILKNLLILYLHSNPVDKIILHSTKSKKPVTHDSFYQGQLLRVAIRFQGLLFLKNAQGNLFYRLQHQVSAIYV